VTPKLDEDAVGTSAGDSFTYEDTLPDDYPDHGGATATFHVTIKDVREKTLPELDDDFAATASGFDTLDELRADLRSSLQRRRIQEAEHDLRGRILEAYLARVEVPLPPSMVEADKEQRLHQLEHQAERYGVAVEDLLAAEGQTRDEFEEQAEKQAKGTVKAQLVLDALGQTLELQLDPSEIDQEIMRHAQQNGLPPQEVARIIQEQGSLPAMIGDILRRKTIDAIVEGAELDGGPSDELLIELGLRADPDAVSDAIMQGATVVEAPADDAPADDAADDEVAGGAPADGDED
jgi:trigger factor